MRFAWRRLQLVESLTNLELVLQEGARLTGTISGLEPDQWPKILVWAHLHGDGRSNPGPRLVHNLHSSVDFEGRFRFSGLSPGRWKIWATLDGSAQYTERHVEISPGEGEVTIDLPFLDAGQILQGRVTLNGKPAAGLRIYSADVLTDEQGRFTIEVGERAFTLHIPGPWGSVLHRVDPRVESYVEIPIETYRVRGTVVDAAGLTLPDVEVSIHDLGPRKSLYWQQRTDASGAFEIPVMLKGAYRFEVASESGSLTQSLQIDRAFDDLRLIVEPPEGAEASP